MSFSTVAESDCVVDAGAMARACPGGVRMEEGDVLVREINKRKVRRAVEM